MIPWWEILARLLLSLFLSGLIGWDRESRGKPAGLRTNMLVAMSATLYVLASQEAALRHGEVQDTVRAMAGIATGISFLGAGAIMRSPAGARTLTTAAALWAAAAIGYAVGVGSYLVAVCGAMFAFVVLRWFVPIERLVAPPQQEPTEEDEQLPRSGKHKHRAK